MAHMWAKFKRGVHTAAKVAGAVGAVALAVHGIHKSLTTGAVDPHYVAPHQEEVVQYRYLGPTEALSCSDAHFRTIRFQMRDWAGNIAPMGSFVVIELCFMDTDPYSM